MPSFDVVSRIDMQELRNAVAQASREIANRFDFKGSDARIESGDDLLTLHADDDYKLGQLRDVLYLKVAKRGVDLASLAAGEVQVAASGKAQQVIRLRQGIDAELGKKIIKAVKDAKLKVQASIQADQVRINGKKRDDLQETIALLRRQKFEQPLQYVNFRD